MDWFVDGTYDIAESSSTIHTYPASTRQTHDPHSCCNQSRGTLTFSATREEHAHDEDLQACHADHQSALKQAEVEYPLLRAAHRAEVPVLTRAKVLLLPRDRRYPALDERDRLFYAAKLLGSRAAFLGEVCAGFVFDLVSRLDGQQGDSPFSCSYTKGTYRDVKVNSLVRKGRDAVVEAESVFSCPLCSEDIVSLPLFLSAQYHR